MIEIEVQNETYQSESKVKFLVVPRIGEGIRLLEPSGQWASFDVLDVWYEKASYGEVWVPFIHVRATPQASDYGAVLRPDLEFLPTEAG